MLLNQTRRSPKKRYGQGKSQGVWLKVWRQGQGIATGGLWVGLGLGWITSCRMVSPSIRNMNSEYLQAGTGERRRAANDDA